MMSEPKIFDAPAIRAAVGLGDLIEPVAQAFADFSRGLGEAPICVFAPAGSEGDVHVKSAWLSGRSVFTVKVGTWFAARAAKGLPGASGYVAVHDATTGDLLALLQDEHHLSDVRTAAAGALATSLLSRADSRVLAVLGTGVQAYLQVLAALEVRPIENVVIWGRNVQAASKLGRALRSRAAHVAVTVAGQVEEAVLDADVIVTATASTRPILRGPWLRAGQHVTAVGADDPGKAELDPACYARADLVVVDGRAQAVEFAGDLRAAIASAAVTESRIDAELGQLVLGRHPGRRDAAQITVAKLVGLGVQDLAAAETALRLLSLPPAASRPASSLDLTGDAHE